MDRIAALRNIEDALAEYERGETDLESMEQTVTGVLRTFATDFDDLTPYRASGDDSADGLVVVAPSRRDARERVQNLVDRDVDVTVDRLTDE